MSYKCLKCNSPVKSSPHNKLTGYESYRCSNKECHSLFDISDFSIKNSNFLKEPIWRFDHFKRHFNELKESEYTFLSLGSGKLTFLNQILEVNKNARLIIPSRVIEHNFKKKDQLIVFQKLIRKKYLDIRNGFILVEEMFPNQYVKIENELKNLKSKGNTILFINSHKMNL